MEININKFREWPNNYSEALESLTEIKADLLKATHLLIFMLENNGEEYKDIHKDRITEFLKKYTL